MVAAMRPDASAMRPWYAARSIAPYGAMWVPVASLIVLSSATRAAAVSKSPLHAAIIA